MNRTPVRIGTCVIAWMVGLAASGCIPAAASWDDFVAEGDPGAPRAVARVRLACSGHARAG